MRGWFVALCAVLTLCAISTQAAATYTIQGQSSGSSTWFQGTLNGWQELDFIPLRIDVTGGPVTNVAVTVSFPRDNGANPPIPGIQDLYNWSTSSNLSIVSGPTLSTVGSVWTYTINITVTNNQEADLYFYARLASGAHGYGGNSLKINATPGSGSDFVSIFKTSPGSGTPDLSIVKTGPAFINAGSFVTYTLTYYNTTNSTAAGVQITDFLPTNATYVSCSGGCTGNTNNSSIVWDLGLVTNGASGTVSYTMFVSTNALNGSSIVNTAEILTIDNDSNSGNNSSTATTIVTNGCVGATIGAQPVTTTACPGSAATFSVGANGRPPFTYQWLKNGTAISGATSSFYTIASASAVDVASYSVLVTNGCGSVSSSAATLSLNTATTASALTSVATCPSNNVSFSTTAAGTGPFTYQWQKNGSNLTGQTNSSLALTSVVSTNAGTYSVVVTGTCNSVTNSATLSVNTLASSTGLTSITNNCSGTLAAFTETVNGTGPFTYVWKKNGSVVSGQTNSSFVIAATALSDAGTYTVEVTGSCNSITNSATLVVANGTFGTALTNLVLCPGSAANFSTVASGAGPFSYQWFKNGSIIGGETGSTYSIASVAAADAGTYSVAITGNCNKITNSATLTVNTPLSGGTMGNQTVCAGQSVTFATAPAGNGPFTYTWKKDGVIQGSTSNSISVVSAVLSDAGTYTVEVNGPCNSVTNNAVLTVNSPTTASALTSLVRCPGQSATFSTAASGTGPFTFVWKKNGVATGNTTSLLTVTSVAAGDAGTYTIEVSGACNSVTNSATLTVNAVTTATALTSATNCVGDTVTFSTTVAGTGPFGYIWKKDGVVQSSTTNSLTVVGVSTSDAGSYTVEVSGTCNNVTNSATLRVNSLTAATGLTPQVVCEGNSASFGTTASGTGPFAYVWKKNGVATGTTTSALTIASATLADAGTYTVEVSGTCNSVTNSATLTVNALTAATGLTPVVVCEGNPASFNTTASGTGPFAYVWRKNGVATGNTTSSLTIASATTADAGTYTVEVSGTCNSVTNSATLTVNALTAATALTPVVVCEGSSAAFSTTASGTGPFTYVWKKDGVVLGNSSSALMIASAALGDAGTYTVEVTGTCNSVTNSATLTVNALTVSSSLNDQTICPGQSVTFTTTPSGTGPFAYVWKKDGVVQTSTTNFLTIGSVASGDAGVYSVEVNGTCNAVTNSATLTVNTPTVASDLTSLVLCPGNTATFTTVASGTGPFTYVWKKDGVVQSSTNATLTIGTIAAADAGNYTVEVTGACNSVTNVATLTVNDVTSATALSDSTLCPGQSATFATTVSGTGPFAYIWKKDGVVQANTTSALTIASVASGDAGVYTVEVSGACNSVTNSATLTVNEVTAATSLADLVVCEGKPATFSTVATGTGPFTYVWKKDGVVQGGTSNTLAIASTATADAGNYTVEVTGFCTSVTNSATLTVNSLTAATPLTDIITCGQSATFTTVVSGTGPFTYVWKKDGVVQSSTTNSLTIASVASGDAGTYTVEVTGACNSVTNSATLTLNADTAATALGDRTVCEGLGTTFSTTVSGSGPFTYVWKKDGVVQSSTTNSLELASVTSGDAGTYTVEITGACNSVTNSAVLTVNTPTTASSLTSLVVCPGQSATFTTVPSGTGPFTYVWKKDGVVQASTTNVLTVASTAAADAGAYTVEVLGACNSVTNVATLTVNENTSATSLTDLVLCPGLTATFTTIASGTGPFAYVWKKDGAVLNGETNSVITIASVTAANTGTYSVEVAGVCNSVTNSATLTVNENVSATALTDAVVCENQPVSFSTTASGTGPMTYVWKKDGVALAGETNSSISIASAQLSDAGVYTVEVAGVCTSATNSATLVVNKLTTSSALTSLVVCPGQSAAFTTVPTGTGPFTYAWKKDGVMQASATNVLTVPSAIIADAGTYTVEVYGTCNAVTNVATLTVNENTAATSLTDLVLCPGQSASFTTTASGTGPFSYVWKKDGTVLNDETNSTLNVASVTSANAGTYSVEVTGVCNAVTNSATLTVNENVSATALTDVVVCENQSAAFSTTASGTGISYVWKKDGSVLPGQTNSSISIASAQLSDGGIYTVEVAGVCTSVTNSATLTVNQLTTSSALTSLVVCPGQSATFTTVPVGTGPFTYVWKKDGVVQVSTTNFLTVAPALAADAGTYTVEVYGTCNSVTNVASLTVNENTSATSLNDLVLCPGQLATFATAASGTGPFSYVWKKDGVVLNDETNNTLNVAAVTSANAGVYTVEVAGVCNSVTNGATLTVNENVGATALTDVVACENQPVSFATTASGTGPISFVWKKDGTVLTGQTNSSISIASAQLSDAGVYAVEVSGICTSVTNNANLTVNQLTASSALTSMVVCPGQSATFATIPTGMGPFTYVWKKDGVVQASATNVLTVASAVGADAGTYTVEVYGTCNSVTNVATLTVNENTSAVGPADVVLCPGQTATLTTVVSGTGPFGFVWKKDGVVLTSETTNALSIASVTAADAGSYTVEVSGVCNSVTNTAVVTVNENVSSTALNDRVVCQGDAATFTTIPAGTGPYTFVWKKDGVVLVGQTNNSITISAADLPDAGLYTVEVSGLCTAVTNSATLTVNSTTVASDLSSLVVCPGQNATFSTIPSGTGPFSFAWSKDGQPLAGQTNSTITVSGAAAADAGTYTVHVTGTCNSVDKSATLTVNENTAATGLTDLVLCPGQTATFVITTSGTGPFGYVWKKDGAVLNGETNNSLSIAAVTSANAGTYSVEITGICNNVTNSATLTVNENVSATALADVVVCENQPATFSTTASGTGVNYLWKKDGNVLTGQTNSSISIASAQLSDAGVYSVEVTGVCTSVTNSANLTVNHLTTSSALASLIVCPGQSATFTTVPIGTGPFTYVWKKDGVVQSTATNVLTIASAVAADAGTYTVEVYGTCNAVTNVATLMVNENTAATSLTDLVLCPGQTATFTTTASGTGPFGYVWKKDGVVVTSETNNSLTIASVTASDAGNYSVEVSGVCNNVTNNAVLTVNENVSATALADVVVCENQPASFATTASGTGPLVYVWKKDGTVLGGQTNSSISIALAQVSDAGVYTVEVTGICTSATNSATLTVNQLTASSALTSLVVCPSQSATFTTVPTGTGPFTYVWKKDGVVQTSTTNVLTVASVVAADAGSYTVEVYGTCNSVTNVAMLAVNENTAATSLSDLVLCPGQTATFATSTSGTGPFNYVWKKDGTVLNDETNSTLNVASVTSANAGTYSVEVTGVCNAVTNSATLTVNENVSATALTDVVVCENGPATFSTTASGTGISYVWKKDGNVLPGQTNSSISITSAQLADAGIYTVEVTGVCTSVTNSATLTVNRLTTTSDLTSLVLCPGKDATFTTVASGTGPFSYVWSKDGQPLNGETTDHLIIRKITASDAGTYNVHVVGTCGGSDKSATLTVNQTTSASALTSLVLCPGDPAVFMTIPSGSGPFTYVWKKDGIVQGSTSNSLVMFGINNTDAGTYTVEVSGACTSVTNTATLSVNTNASATPLVDLVRCPGTSAVFSTVPSGTGPFSYTWRKDGVTINGQTNSSLTIASVAQSSAGVYSVEVSGACSTATNAARLVVNTNVSATALANLNACPGTTTAFSTVASGTGPFTYQWSKNGQNLNGQTNSSLTLANVSVNDAGTYSVVVYGACNSVTNSGTLSVGTLAATPLSNINTCQGQAATFSTVASGSAPFSYVWKKNGTTIGGANSSAYTIANPQSTDAGTYSVIVSSSCLSVTNSAILSVGQAISASALSPLTRCPGQPATFSTAVTGNGPFAFVWKQNGQVLNGQTNSAITFSSVANSNGGTYSVEVTGFCNSVTNSAILTVKTNASATPLGDFSVCAGQSVTFTTTASGTAPFSYRWRRNGSVISGATTSSYTIASASTNNAGTYSVEVTGTCNTATNFGSLTVAPQTTVKPLVDQFICGAESNVVTFTAIASGGAPFSYAWFTNETLIADQTGSILTLTNVPGSTNVYVVKVVVTGGCGSASSSANLTVYNTQVITGAITFVANQDIVINDNQPATPYPSTIDVHCIPGLPQKVRVTLLNVTHSYPRDINAMVVSPSGQALPLMVECGAGNPLSFTTITFDDEASSSLPQNDQIATGTYKPTSYLANPQFPYPAPAPNTSHLASMAGRDPSGTWSLYVLDDEILDDGFMKGGWALTLVYGDETQSKFINSVYLQDGTFQTTLVGPAGLPHIVQSSPDLVNWTSIATNTLPTGSFTITLPVQPQGPKQFYRAIRPF